MKLFGTNTTIDLTLDNDPFADNQFKTGQPASKAVSFKDDPIALSCASYRHWLTHSNTRWLDLDSVVATDEDRTEADAIRRYYRSRIVWDQLKHGGTLSEFRAKLGKLVSGDLEITSKEIGLIYRLPYFYVEDRGLDYVIESTVDDVTARHRGGQVEPVTAKYRLITKILKSRRSGESIQYWLKSDQCSAPCLLAIDQKNPLRMLVESVLNREEVTLKSFLFPQEHRGYHRGRCFFQLGNVEIV